jgi:hypothetical protein
VGREFRLAQRKKNWGEDRVLLFDGQGDLFSLPADWTDAGPPDPYVAVAAGRSAFRVADLVELAALIEQLWPEGCPRGVKPTTPYVSTQ